jgi:hypothetical protein
MLAASLFTTPELSVGPVGNADPLSGALTAGQQLARKPFGLVDVREGRTPALPPDPAPAVIDGDHAEEIALQEDGVAARDMRAGSVA